MSGKKGTVRDFKNMIERENGGQTWDFRNETEAHRTFWQKLNRIGARNIKEIPPEKCDDIDATVHLSEWEWEVLEEEYRNL